MEHINFVKTPHSAHFITIGTIISLFDLLLLFYIKDCNLLCTVYVMNYLLSALRMLVDLTN